MGHTQAAKQQREEGYLSRASRCQTRSVCRLPRSLRKTAAHETRKHEFVLLTSLAQQVGHLERVAEVSGPVRRACPRLPLESTNAMTAMSMGVNVESLLLSLLLAGSPGKPRSLGEPCWWHRFLHAPRKLKAAKLNLSNCCKKEDAHGSQMALPLCGRSHNACTPSWL